MITLDEMWRLVGQRQISILFGNGFSRAWRDGLFDYGTLFDVATFADREEHIRQVFQVLGTYDFESVTSRLQASKDILVLYSEDLGPVGQLERDSQLIKDALLRAIANTHPHRPNQISVEEYQHVRNFLRRFSRIYTVNYDLLMYWARNQNIHPLWETNDGFHGDQWNGPSMDQEIFFLHGALHLYETIDGVKKHVYANQGQAIIDKVQESLGIDIFPLFVSEPTSEAKKTRIHRNPYLDFCLRRLRQETECVFIIGHGFSEVDSHIFSAINSSNVNHVFIALHGPFDSDANRRSIENAQTYLARAGRDMFFLQAETIPLWRPVIGG